MENAVTLKERFAAWNSPYGWADVRSRVTQASTYTMFTLGSLSWLYTGFHVRSNLAMIGLWSIPGAIAVQWFLLIWIRSDKRKKTNSGENCIEFG